MLERPSDQALKYEKSKCLNNQGEYNLTTVRISSKEKKMICFVMIMLCFHVYDNVMYDDEYDYELTFMTLFIIAKQVLLNHVMNNMTIWWATLFYTMSRCMSQDLISET